MKNLTIITEFVLLGFSRNPHILNMLFALFLVIYVLTLMGNLVMILVIRTDSHLKTPMYFFLGHLSFLDLSLSSITTPKMLENLLTQKKTISVWGCMAQSFFLILSGSTEACLLSAMAYDHYAAICHPLLYSVIVNRPLCVGMVTAAWAVGFLNLLPNSLFTYNLHFCGPNVIPHFCCELSSLFPLSCTDPTANEALLAGSCALLGFVTFPLILFSYSRIISAIISIPSSGGQGKAFSTSLFRYMTPLSGSMLEQVVSIQYSVITSLLNPLIYSLKNQEVKIALHRVLKQ
ncbi:hypothetical protein FD754_008735 [Muntiacus muntjak]|uniref:G-protein coupled receptors family 1 profile domain-containing protein n=1 Tax=Muntiacus muntjak TaxID=9888 RepID=A0A5N3WRR6_MUNMU|nr:hypothetical protein FD754_008735 [Muntiacus muntjak]